SVITIGDRVTYTLKITRDKNLRIKQPGPGANLGMFEIKDYNIQPPVETDGKITEQFDYVISVFDTGKFVIPPFPVAFFPSDTSRKYQIIESEPVNIFVKSLLSEGDVDIRDIKPPLEPPYNYTRLILLLGGLLLLIAAAVAGYIIYRKRKHGEPIFRKEVIRPAHEIAYEELDKLLASKLLEKGEFKQFYSKLSDILRLYLENRFFIRALEDTTSELMDSLKEIEISEENSAICKEVLDLADLVKFAKYIPQTEETNRAVQLVKEFIEATHLEFEAVEKIEKVEENESLAIENNSETEIRKSQINGGEN
ncbi:MAG: hypothetical protein ACE5GL_09240, partial [Calditrichia bacterium]